MPNAYQDAAKHYASLRTRTYELRDAGILEKHGWQVVQTSEKAGNVLEITACFKHKYHALIFLESVQGERDSKLYGDELMAIQSHYSRHRAECNMCGATKDFVSTSIKYAWSDAEREGWMNDPLNPERPETDFCVCPECVDAARKAGE